MKKYNTIIRLIMLGWVAFYWVISAYNNKISSSDSIIISLLILIYFAVAKK